MSCIKESAASCTSSGSCDILIVTMATSGKVPKKLLGTRIKDLNTYVGTCGVYIILNNVTRKVYAGSSSSIGRRIKNHVRYLRNNTHKNPHLQATWNKHGEDSFSFYCVYECRPAQRLKKEFAFIKQCKLFDRSIGYNMNENMEAPPNWTGKKHKPETIKLLSEAMMGPKNPMYNRKHTEESKQKMSKSLKEHFRRKAERSN